ncbi:MAG TPA: dihydroorotase, partial [Gammaproteobacteria bacterium]
MNRLLLANATLVNEGQTFQADVLLEDGRIERIGSGSVPEGAEVIDLGGKHVLPGIIDDQVHFREPGATHKA